jgi:hypothetical protein
MSSDIAGMLPEVTCLLPTLAGMLPIAAEAFRQMLEISILFIKMLLEIFLTVGFTCEAIEEP